MCSNLISRVHTRYKRHSPLPFSCLQLIVNVFTRGKYHVFGGGAATMRMISKVVGLTWLMAACGGGDAGTDNQQRTGGPEQQPAQGADAPASNAPAGTGKTHNVNMVLEGSSYKYVPDQLTVGPNDLIRYHNKSGGPHNVAFYEDSIPKGAQSAISIPEPMAPLSSKLAVNPDEVLEVKLNNAPKGEYKYYCTPHLAMGMKAKLTVQ
jgi:plastocyanin